MLQWGHDLSVMDTWGILRSSRGWYERGCFNGAMTFRSWIPGWGPTIPPASDVCFNGAMTFRSWIPEQGQGPGDGPGSFPRFNGAMTFRSWILDNPTTPCRVPRTPQGFNGAMTFRSWIPAERCADNLCNNHGLQWGHDLSVMDTGELSCGAQRPFARGWFLGERFNGAMTFRSWIPGTRHADDPSGIPTILQTIVWRFNGAMTFRSWIQRTARVPRACFNGAMTFRSWIQGGRLHLCNNETWASMGP